MAVVIHMYVSVNLDYMTPFFIEYVYIYYIVFIMWALCAHLPFPPLFVPR